jgi:hypothetical protein
VGNGVQVSGGCSDSDTRPETSHHLGSKVAVWKRHPKVGVKRVETRRHDPHENGGCTVQDEDFVENLWVASKFRLPEAVVHNEYGRSAGAPVFGQDGATQKRGNPKEVEGVGGHQFEHSGAREARVELAQTNGHLTISVRDDGKGIPKRLTEFKPGSVGVGIGGMRQRVSELGGKLKLENTNPGTLVQVVIPNMPAEKGEQVASGIST